MQPRAERYDVAPRVEHKATMEMETIARGIGQGVQTLELTPFPPGCVARRLHTTGMRPAHALPSERLDAQPKISVH